MLIPLKSIAGNIVDMVIFASQIKATTGPDLSLQKCLCRICLVNRFYAHVICKSLWFGPLILPDVILHLWYVFYYVKSRNVNV